MSEQTCVQAALSKHDATQPKSKYPRMESKVFGVFAFVGLVLPFFLPPILSNGIKPVFIVLLIFIGKHHLSAARCVAVTLFILAYTVGATFGWPSWFTRYVNIVSFSVLYMLCSGIRFDETDCAFVLNCLFYAALLFSIIVSISNPLISTLYGIGRLNVNMLFIQMNVDQVAYVITPGMIACFQKLLYKKSSSMTRVLEISSLFVMLYALLYTSCRGAFLAALGGILISFAPKLIRLLAKVKIWRIAIIAIGVVLLFCLLKNLLPEHWFTRLFSISSYSNTSGRIDTYKFAISLVDDWLIGNGTGYWSTVSNVKIHNQFIWIYVETGAIGLACFFSMLLLPIMKNRSFLNLAYFFAALMQAMIESGDSYTFWTPFLLFCIISNSEKMYQPLKTINSV